ncbi:hypothetical protein Fleli_0012 [Bernardetia litoralis DSM 6794]|uniref:Uncharacterized protein n=1 Tax=Bernardetia litoralis (strain ATCC 23117 / DSM 6794 / NBRC 15988 / NCIMB 1366 / Fx l1 / Sio-4) TaxID=880071 RepID=I4AEY9_BERLS|nr:hypothetical protein [Bernardetia litoralis]AFM02524.1 hypothetical protein Fleli_0012 [Bernardetia litoralis DSM 6794]
MKNYNLFTLYSILFFLFLFVSMPVFSQERGQMQRVGCICRDGVRQNTIGMGACSGHKGVKFWLYAEVSIYQQYANDLPAIPDSDLVQLTPEEARQIAKSIAKEVTETLPILYDGNKKETEENSLIEEERRELEKLKEENRQQQGIISTPSKRFEVLDFFIPFVMVLVVILLFLLIVMVIKKVL